METGSFNNLRVSTQKPSTPFLSAGISIKMSMVIIYISNFKFSQRIVKNRKFIKDCVTEICEFHQRLPKKTQISSSYHEKNFTHKTAETKCLFCQRIARTTRISSNDPEKWVTFLFFSMTSC